MIFNSSQFLDIILSLSSGSCLAIVQINSFEKCPSSCFQQTSFAAWVARAVRYPAKPSMWYWYHWKYITRLRVTPGLVGAQEPLASMTYGKEQLGPCALDHSLLTKLPVIHPPPLWKTRFTSDLHLFIFFLPYPYRECFKGHQQNWMVKYLQPDSWFLNNPSLQLCVWPYRDGSFHFGSTLRFSLGGCR